MKRCGCGRLAEWAVYKHKEPHCFHCMEEAAVCENVIVKRVWDWGEEHANRETAGE